MAHRPHVALLCIIFLLEISLCISSALPRSFVRTAQRVTFRTAMSATSAGLSVAGALAPFPLPVKFTFVGGKGGVGKTTTSSAIALISSDSAMRTLLVSTDPAHSLGDAVGVDLTSGLVTPIPSEQYLWALEIDVDGALAEFKNTVSGLDTADLASSFGIPTELVELFGINEIADIFANPPPGIDEIISLTKIFQFADKMDGTGTRQMYDRIIIDTAPTGHTLRLLQLPRFLDTLVGRMIRLRAKLTGALDTFKGFFGGRASADQGANKLSMLLDKLDALQADISRVQRTLKDHAQTQFVVVTIPAAMAVAETKHLVHSLDSEGIKVASLICNQVFGLGADRAYLRNRAKGQKKCIEDIKRHISHNGVRLLGGQEVSADLPSTVTAQPSRTGIKIELTEVPIVDAEATGVHGLRYFHTLAHAGTAGSAAGRKVNIFGGKGGVGKTTSAASLAVGLADAGLRVLVLSTDPAHSLGDALLQPLSGTPTRVDLCAPAANGGELWAMEIDPAQAMEEFRSALRSATGDNAAGDDRSAATASTARSSSQGGMLSALGLPNLSGELSEMLLSLQDPPPGSDEIVALSKVAEYLDTGVEVSGRVVKFDRVILDTAPTGHTLRMLQLPQFLLKLIAKLRALRSRGGAAGGMMGMLGVSQSPPPQEANSLNPVPAASLDKLAALENRMMRLQQLLHSPEECEFTIVTIPTELATAETVRLLDALQQEEILVRRLIINQVIPSFLSTVSRESAPECTAVEAAAGKYLGNLRAGQARALQDLRGLSESMGVKLVEVPYYDTEVRTVYGLRLISNLLSSVSSQ